MGPSEVEVKQASFEGWAVVEMMGHRKEIGFVTTQAFGAAVLFRVDTPDLPEREFVITSPEYAHVDENGRQWCPAGTKVKRAASPARSCLVAPGSLYAITPCSEEAARTAIERMTPRPLILLELPPKAALLPGVDAAIAFGDEDDQVDDDEDDFASDENGALPPVEVPTMPHQCAACAAVSGFCDEHRPF